MAVISIFEIDCFFSVCLFKYAEYKSSYVLLRLSSSVQACCVDVFKFSIFCGSVDVWVEFRDLDSSS